MKQRRPRIRFIPSRVNPSPADRAATPLSLTYLLDHPTQPPPSCQPCRSLTNIHDVFDRGGSIGRPLLTFLGACDFTYVTSASDTHKDALHPYSPPSPSLHPAESASSVFHLARHKPRHRPISSGSIDIFRLEFHQPNVDHVLQFFLHHIAQKGFPQP